MEPSPLERESPECVVLDRVVLDNDPHVGFFGGIHLDASQKTGGHTLAMVESMKLESNSAMRHSTRTIIYMGVSLNGGTPKTPQNDHF